ncbi:hypothetical protein PMAYCL1PPCAC_00165, partial [Pristionchus mayeri]
LQFRPAPGHQTSMEDNRMVVTTIYLPEDFWAREDLDWVDAIPDWLEGVMGHVLEDRMTKEVRQDNTSRKERGTLLLHITAAGPDGRPLTWSIIYGPTRFPPVSSTYLCVLPGQELTLSTVRLKRETQEVEAPPKALYNPISLDCQRSRDSLRRVVRHLQKDWRSGGRATGGPAGETEDGSGR